MINKGIYYYYYLYLYYFNIFYLVLIFQHNQEEWDHKEIVYYQIYQEDP